MLPTGGKKRSPRFSLQPIELNAAGMCVRSAPSARPLDTEDSERANMTSPDAPTARLLRFNRDVLAQALALAAAHELPGAPPYLRPVGVHLRHVIEHYEALLYPAEAGVVDYDSRPRDALLEQDPSLEHSQNAGDSTGTKVERGVHRGQDHEAVAQEVLPAIYERRMDMGP